MYVLPQKWVNLKENSPTCCCLADETQEQNRRRRFNPNVILPGADIPHFKIITSFMDHTSQIAVHCARISPVSLTTTRTVPCRAVAAIVPANCLFNSTKRASWNTRPRDHTYDTQHSTLGSERGFVCEAQRWQSTRCRIPTRRCLSAKRELIETRRGSRSNKRVVAWTGACRAETADHVIARRNHARKWPVLLFPSIRKNATGERCRPIPSGGGGS